MGYYLNLYNKNRVQITTNCRETAEKVCLIINDLRQFQTVACIQYISTVRLGMFEK